MRPASGRGRPCGGEGSLAVHSSVASLPALVEDRGAAEAAGHTLEFDLRGGDLLVVRVADSGPGILPKHHERIFEEFERVPGTEARGHGLGLAIARRIARHIDGDLSVESDGVSGSAFSLHVPAHPEHRPADVGAPA